MCLLHIDAFTSTERRVCTLSSGCESTQQLSRARKFLLCSHGGVDKKGHLEILTRTNYLQSTPTEGLVSPEPQYGNEMNLPSTGKMAKVMATSSDTRIIRGHVPA